MSEPVRQLDIGPVQGKHKPSVPIPGSTRDREMQARVQAQAERLLPGIGSHEAERVEAMRPRPTRQAWGEAASAGGFALALTLRSKGLKWAVRVLTLVAWFIVPTPVSGLITLVWLAWCVVGVSAWVKRLSRRGKGVDACRCKC